MARQFISCFKGMAPCAFPEEWLKDFDFENGFAYVNGEARIDFESHGAYGVCLDIETHTPIWRKLPEEDIYATPWQDFCTPWEGHEVAKIFGFANKVMLDELFPEE